MPGMLVLARKVNETIRIGDDIEIVVVGVHGSSVRLGIRAPKSLAIDRQEIYERKRSGANPDCVAPRSPGGHGKP